jgi:hypothetical protein
MAMCFMKADWAKLGKAVRFAELGSHNLKGNALLLKQV